MHPVNIGPSIDPNVHPGCYDLYKALKQCHRKNRWMKFAGVCNDQKAALDKCVRSYRFAIHKHTAFKSAKDVLHKSSRELENIETRAKYWEKREAEEKQREQSQRK